MRLFRLVLRLVYAFNTVATQIVVARERAGEAAGITLSSLVTCAAIGTTLSGNKLPMPQGQAAAACRSPLAGAQAP